MQVSLKRDSWFRQLTERKRLCLYSNVILMPAVLVYLLYDIFGILLSIPRTYLILDVVVIGLIRRQECARIARQKQEEEEERSGRAIQYVRRTLEELREIDM